MSANQTDPDSSAQPEGFRFGEYIRRYAAWVPLLIFLIFASVQAAYRSLPGPESSSNPGTQALASVDCAAYCQGFLECVTEAQPALKHIRDSDQWQQASAACQAGCQKQSQLAASCMADVLARRCDTATRCMNQVMHGQ